MKKVVAAIGIMTFLFGAATGVFAAEDMVKIGYLRIIMSLPTFVAQERGLSARGRYHESLLLNVCKTLKES